MGACESCRSDYLDTFQVYLSLNDYNLSCEVNNTLLIQRDLHPFWWYHLSGARKKVVDDDDVYYYLTCHIPVGVGRNYSIQVVQQQCSSEGQYNSDGGGSDSVVVVHHQQHCNSSSPAAVCFSFPPPQIRRVDPLWGSTSGGYSMQIHGEFLGPSASLRDKANITVFFGGRPITIIESLSNHSIITVMIPSGEGKGHVIEVVVDGQSSMTGCATPLILFDYSPPAILSTFREDDDDDGDGDRSDNSSLVEGGKLFIVGKNFGRSPHFMLNGQNLSLLHVTHNRALVMIPPGQGRDNLLSVEAGRQFAEAPFVLSYQRPRIHSISPHACGEAGGHIEGCLIRVIGSNFGLSLRAPHEVEVWIGQQYLVPVEDIHFVSSCEFQFVPPAGKGSNHSLRVIVSNLSSSHPSDDNNDDNDEDEDDDVSFSFLPTIIQEARLLPSSLNQTIDGRSIIAISGQALGKQSSAVVHLIYDTIENRNNSTSSSSSLLLTRRRMMTAKTSLKQLQVCDVFNHQEDLILCAVYPQMAKTISLTLTLNNSRVFTSQVTFPIPTITAIWRSENGNAVGGEELVLFGEHFGSFPSPSIQIIEQSSSLSSSSSSNTICLANDQEWISSSKHKALGPMLRCTTAPMAVGTYTIIGVISGQPTLPFHNYSLTCKAGYYGMVGEYCTSCTKMKNGSSLYGQQGFHCPRDNMSHPQSAPGWYIYDDCDETTISTTTTTTTTSSSNITTSPSLTQSRRRGCTVKAFPCQPSESCLGGNLCSYPYTGTTGCSSCESNYFRINSLCKPCWISYLAIALFCFIVLLLVIGYLSSSSSSSSMAWRVVYCAKVIFFVDIMQTLGLLSYLDGLDNIGYLQDLLNVFSISYFNWEVMMVWQNGCWPSNSNSSSGGGSGSGSSHHYEEVYTFSVAMALAIPLLCFIILLAMSYDAFHCFGSSSSGNGRRSRRRKAGAVFDEAQCSRDHLVLTSPPPPPPSSGVSRHSRFFFILLNTVVGKKSIWLFYLLVTMSYVMLCSMAMTVFHCRANALSDGRSYLPYLGNSFASVCYVTGYSQAKLMPFSVVLLVIIGLGLPVLIIIVTLLETSDDSLCCGGDKGGGGSDHGTESSDDGGTPIHLLHPHPPRPTPPPAAPAAASRRMDVYLLDKPVPSLSHSHLRPTNSQQQQPFSSSPHASSSFFNIFRSLSRRWRSSQRDDLKSSSCDMNNDNNTTIIGGLVRPQCEWFLSVLLLKKATIIGIVTVMGLMVLTASPSRLVALRIFLSVVVLVVVLLSLSLSLLLVFVQSSPPPLDDDEVVSKGKGKKRVRTIDSQMEAAQIPIPSAPPAEEEEEGGVGGGGQHRLRGSKSSLKVDRLKRALLPSHFAIRIAASDLHQAATTTPPSSSSSSSYPLPGATTKPEEVASPSGRQFWHALLPRTSSATSPPPPAAAGVSEQGRTSRSVRPIVVQQTNPIRQAQAIPEDRPWSFQDNPIRLQRGEKKTTWAAGGGGAAAGGGGSLARKSAGVKRRPQRMQMTDSSAQQAGSTSTRESAAADPRSRPGSPCRLPPLSSSTTTTTTTTTTPAAKVKLPRRYRHQPQPSPSPQEGLRDSSGRGSVGSGSSSQQHHFLSLLDSARRTPPAAATTTSSAAPPSPADARRSYQIGFLPGRHLNSWGSRSRRSGLVSATTDEVPPPPVPPSGSSSEYYGDGLAEVGASSVMGLRMLRRAQCQSLPAHRPRVFYPPHRPVIVPKRFSSTTSSSSTAK
eukprot:scaffold1946_cov188-Ochromonas_danica.AAC.2